MIISMEDWIFNVDMMPTMAYSAQEAVEHCDCGYCRNFYATVDDAYPKLRPFLAQFGVDIEAPDELMPYDYDGKLIYYACYAISGRIIRKGLQRLTVDDLVVQMGYNADLYTKTGCPDPNFFINVADIVLPWILPEPMREVISPANEPTFLKRMWNRLLRRSSRGISS